MLGGRHVTVRQLGGPNLSVLSVSYVFECDWFVHCEILPDGKISRTEILGLVSLHLRLDQCGYSLTVKEYHTPVVLSLSPWLFSSFSVVHFS